VGEASVGKCVGGEIEGGDVGPDVVVGSKVGLFVGCEVVVGAEVGDPLVGYMVGTPPVGYGVE